MDKVLEMCGSLDEWNQVSDRNGMQIYSQDTSASGLRTVRSEGKFEFPAYLVADYCCDAEIRCEIDPIFKEAKQVEDIGAGLVYEYARMRGTFVFSDRDFCTIRYRKEEADGRVIIVAVSREHPDCPEASGAVRAEIVIFGYVVTPEKDDPEKCTAQLVMQGDLKGNIPTMLANQAILINGKFLHKLNKRLKADSAE